MMMRASVPSIGRGELRRRFSGAQFARLFAFVEYCFAVPANRIGHQVYSTAELKTMQEVITFIVFAVFSIAFLNEPITINHALGFAFIALGAFFVFKAPL